jgi:hypothetical protein
MKPLKRINLINSSTVFISTIVIILTLVSIVYLTGLESHRSLYLNSLITITILAVIFICFITVGLYNGWKLKDDLGNFKKYFSKYPEPSNVTIEPSPPEFSGDDIGGCLLSIVLWIVIGLFGSLILWLIGAFFWGTILVLAGLLYWIIFRAIRLIFRNSATTKGNIARSIRIALVYTLIYISWIYAIILIGHSLSN